MGGAETSLLELLASVRAAEPEWKLTLLLGGNGPLVEKASRLGVAVHVLPIPAVLAKLGDSSGKGTGAKLWGAAAAIRYARQLNRMLRSERPDLVHSTGFKMHVLSAWACPRGIPLIWHIHDYVGSRPLMSRLLRWHAGRCATAIVNSRSVAEEVRAALGEKLRVDCIYNAIDLNRFSPAGVRADLDTLSGLPPAPPATIRVGLVATFAWWKGHRVFLNALSQLPPDLPVRGYIIGGAVYSTAGSQESAGSLRAEAARLGVADRVGFTGHIDDTASAMRALDVVVHASTAPEPFGMVIAEGMACAKPVVVSRAGGARELFEEDVDALSHAPSDAADLARQILNLAAERELRARLGWAGRRRAEASYAGQRLAREVLLAYSGQGVVRTRRPAAVAAAAS